MTYCRNLNPADLLPGNDERESALQQLRWQLSAAQGKAQEAARKAHNLMDSIATTDYAEIRPALEKRLFETRIEQAEAEAKRLGQEMERLSKANEEATTRLESLRELLTFMREHTGEDRVEIWCRLHEELRNLIERIDIYPVGNSS